MNQDILKRAMFAMPLSKEARNSGIMAGFEEDMGKGEDESMEEMPPMARTPQNPEILMNNLRGDMRSVDARYMELAQMVGEEAAQETPPEVLAMLQPQFAAQQPGIGSPPQAQGMPPGMMPPGAPQGMPPGMGAPQGMPPGMGAPQGMPPGMGAQPGMAMPQGGIPMPPGMESAPPFSQGAEQAPQQFRHGGAVEPPTPDGLPPMHAFLGALATPAARLAQMVSGPAGRAAQFVSDKAGALNTALGRMYMPPHVTQPYLENVRGPGGRFTAEQIARGGDLIYPTFTQGLGESVMRLGAQYPRLSSMLPVGALGGALAGATTAGRPGAPTPESDFASQIPMDTAVERAAAAKAMEDLVAGRTQPATAVDMSSPDWTKWTMTERGKQPIPVPRKPMEPVFEQDFGAVDMSTTPEEAPAAETQDPLGAFIEQKLKAQEARDAAKGKPAVGKALTKQERIKAAMGEYEPMFKELVGDDKESAKANALLLLAEAGFKLAGTAPKPGGTMATAIGEAMAGVPRGMAAIAAQERELGIKAKTAALQQAIGDVESQDKYAQAQQLEMLKGDMRLLQEMYKRGTGVIKDGGAGLRISETKDGSFIGSGIDPEDPTVKSAVGSRYTLRLTDNPFVEDRGAAPTFVETNKEERIKLTNTLRSLDDSLTTLDNLKGVYASAYGPNAWFQDKVNNILVPVIPNSVVRPNFDVADASTRIQTGMENLLKKIASANNNGRVAVQEQEWARDTAKGISDPTKFFADKELVAKQFNSMEAMLRNARQQALTQLGYEKSDYVMRTPNTGTQSDPFVVPSDPQEQRRVFNFLGSTIGKVQDPRATVYLRMPNGRVDAFSPTQLRGLTQK